ncbi:unnamed protein product [Adineta steineri]|uniref:Uncharacterized protein n=1 Tax=Adineta steineri TaxID=433720 RepID=A0A815FQU6_9BILA|nr:unnamed protein product [Adineta steineri]CAF3761937.1 unnamed protein product [Adineta steineri]
MKPRYNLRTQSSKVFVSRTNKIISSVTSPSIRKRPKHRQSITINNNNNNKQNRRQSLRLTSILKQTKPRPIKHETPPKWRKVENDNTEENSLINDEDDDYDDLLARHHRRMLEEQKDRKLYERYVRGQRTLRRLQCRRTHTAHLNEATRTRLLRELERERRYTVQDQICAYLTDHTIIFRHGAHLNSNQPMDWSTLEDEIPRQKHFDTIHQLDVMINNLKKVIRTSKSSLSKPRLSVHERQKQRLTAKTTTPVISLDSNISQINEIRSAISPINTISQSTAISRLPIVRFIDDSIRMNNSQHLTCIQNFLLQNNNNNNNNNHHSHIVSNEISTPIGIRKQFLRPKFTHANVSESSQTKKRALEKENCSLVTSTSNNHQSSHANVVIRATSPMVSIKHSAAYRSYPNTRKHPINIHLSTTRRQKRLSYV